MTTGETPAQVLSDYLAVEVRDGLKVLTVRHPRCEASIALQGAHIFNFQPAGQPGLLWLSKDAVFAPGKAIRGGIPVCWPWFGRVADPAHGFARNSLWSLAGHHSTDDGVEVILTLTDNDATRAIWPHHFAAELVIRMGDQLDVQLKAMNTGDSPWSCSGALHSYLNLSDLAGCEIAGMGTDYLDNLQGYQAATGPAQLTIDRSVDRVYSQPQSTVTVDDEGWGRKLAVACRGHNSVVIWNPWRELSASMADFDNDGYRRMVCVESAFFAATKGQMMTVQAGESFVLGTMLRGILREV